MPSSSALMLAIASVVGTGAACITAPAASQSQPLGRNFDVRVGQIVQIAGEMLTVTFERVAEDSRCPTNVKCVWEGDAVVRVALQGQNAERGTLDLHTQAAAKREADFQKYRLRLVQLVPWPKDSGGIPAETYIATLVVTRSP
jgi:hypothetical protein